MKKIHAKELGSGIFDLSIRLCKIMISHKFDRGNVGLKDYVQTHKDFSQRIYMLLIQNRTDYLGYSVWPSCGFSLDKKNTMMNIVN